MTILNWLFYIGIAFIISGLCMLVYIMITASKNKNADKDQMQKLIFINFLGLMKAVFGLALVVVALIMK